MLTFALHSRAKHVVEGKGLGFINHLFDEMESFCKAVELDSMTLFLLLQF